MPDPEFGTLYNKSEGSPIIQVGNYDVSVKSGTAQVADEKTGTYKVGPNETPQFSCSYGTYR